MFTATQLQEIRRASLSRAICDNLDDVEMLQPYAFLMVDEFSNRRVPCRSGSIPRINLDRWREKPRPKEGDGIILSDFEQITAAMYANQVRYKCICVNWTMKSPGTAIPRDPLNNAPKHIR